MKPSYSIILLLFTSLTVYSSRYEYTTQLSLSENPDARINITAIISVHRLKRHMSDDLWYAEVLSVTTDPTDDDLSKCTGSRLYVRFKGYQLETIYKRDAKQPCLKLMVGATYLLKQAESEAVAGSVGHGLTNKDECTVTGVAKDGKKASKSLFCKTEILSVPLSKVVSQDCTVNIQSTLSDKSQNPIERVISKELCRISIKAYSAIGVHVVNRQQLQLQSTKEDGSHSLCSDADTVDNCIERLLKREKISKIEVGALFGDAQVTNTERTGQSLEDIPAITKEGRVAAAFNFLKAVDIVTKLDKEDLKTLLAKQGKKSKSMFDVLAHCSTNTCFETAVDYLKFDKKSRWLKQERYLNMLAQRDKVPDWLIDRLMEMSKNAKVKTEKVHETLILTIGSLARDIRISDDAKEEQVARFFRSGIRGCRYREDVDDCETIWLRGMRNFGSRMLLPLLYDHMCSESSPTVQAEALRALMNMPYSSWQDSGVLDQASMLFLNICPRQHTEYAVRALASDLLLKAQSSDMPPMPHEEFLEKFIDKLKTMEITKESTEFRALVFEKLKLAFSINANHRQTFRSYIKRRYINDFTFPRFGAFSMQGGGSFGESDSLKVGFSVDMAFGAEVLQSSDFDLYYRTAAEEEASLLGFRLFTQGLDQYLAAGQLENLITQSEEADESSPTGAGIQLIFFGKTIRPYWFFQGLGELFSVVWNRATGAEIEGFQGNFLLVNSSQRIILRNGFMLDVGLQSGLSFSTNGSIYISIWSRTLQSRIANNLGLVSIFDMKTHLGTAISLNANASVAVDVEIDFDTDGDAAGAPLRFCGRINQDQANATLSASSHRQSKEGISDKRSTTETFTVPPRTIGLSQGINDMCNEYFGQDDSNYD